MLKASARERKAAETSLGTGTACSRVRCSGASGVISERRLRKLERSGRRGWAEGWDGSVACSAETFSGD